MNICLPLAKSQKEGKMKTEKVESFMRADTSPDDISRPNRNSNLGISRAPLKSQTHQGTSLLTSYSYEEESYT